jgi:hypothetical protein
MMHRIVLQGVCVDITDPLPNEKGKLGCVMTLDVMGVSKKTPDSLPVEFMGEMAVKVSRDILRGDIVTVSGMTYERKHEDGQRVLHLLGWDARVQRAVNDGVVVGRIAKIIKPQRRRDKGAPWCLSFRLFVDRPNGSWSSLWVQQYGDWAWDNWKKLRVGMVVVVAYRLRHWRKRGGRHGLEAVVRNVEVVPMLGARKRVEVPPPDESETPYNAGDGY